MLRDTGTDDVWCETIRLAIPHLEAIVEPVRKLLERGESGPRRERRASVG